MNHPFYFLYGFRLIQLLAAAGVVIMIAYFDRLKPSSALACFVRHRDRLWFAPMLLLVPIVLSHALFFRLFWKNASATAGHILEINIIGVTLNVFYGFVYGVAGCLFASPSRKEDRFVFWTALTVAIVLIVLSWGVSMVMNSFRVMQTNSLPAVLLLGILVLIYLTVRAARGKNAAILDGKIAKGDELKKGEFNPAFAFLWLLVGLAPAPILLIAASSNTQGRNSAIPLLIICMLCNLCGGIGCLGGIKNVAVRIILGLFLAVFFFGLSVLIALWQACSRSGGI